MGAGLLRDSARRLPLASSRGRRASLRCGPRAEITCGTGLVIATDTALVVSGELVIGDNFFLGSGSRIVCLDRVTIGNDVRFGERVSVHDEAHLFEPFPVLGQSRSVYTTKPIHIGDRVWLAANVVVAGGASIGSDSVVGANSVVTRDIPSGVLAAGIPAVVIRELSSAPVPSPDGRR